MLVPAEYAQAARQIATMPVILVRLSAMRSQMMRSSTAAINASSGVKNARLLMLSRGRVSTGLLSCELAVGGRRGAGYLLRSRFVDQTVNLERAPIDHVEEGTRPETEHQDEHGQRYDRRELTTVDLRKLTSERLEVFVLAPLFAK